MKIGPRPLAVATALLLLFGVVGLLTVDDDAGGTQLTAAAAATTAKGTARMAMSMSFDTGGGPSTLTGEGVVDMGAERARMTFTSPLFPGPMEILADGTTVYLSTALPQLKAQAGGKPWLALDASASAVGGGAFGGGTDPLQSLRLLQDKGLARSVRENGTQDVRGVATTRYLAQLDVAEMMKTSGSAQARNLAELTRDADGEMEVWVDADDVVRRAVFRMTFGVGGQSISSTVTTELFDFGVPVDVAPPPPDQVQRLQGPLGLS
jgi:hypothetical protein